MHMALKYHAATYKRLPDEDKVLDAMRAAGAIEPGFYGYPYCSDMKQMAEKPMLDKLNAGPVGSVTLRPRGPVNMGKFLGLWFVYTLLISFFCAYLASRTLAPGTHYLEVFRVVGTAAFMAYAFAHISDWIWKGETGLMTVISLVDGLIYGLLTAGTFGWLWPR
jgi:hypothetical protein